jgi:hypothetical protein
MTTFPEGKEKLSRIPAKAPAVWKIRTRQSTRPMVARAANHTSRMNESETDGLAATCIGFSGVWGTGGGDA